MSAPLTANFYAMEKFDELCQGSWKGSVIVDFGCGFGRNGHLIRSNIGDSGSDTYLIGCDIFKQYLAETKRFNPYDELVVCDVRKLPFRIHTIDHILASELIEHLEKEEGKQVLHDFAELCNGCIIITTPYFPYKQGIVRGNIFERHKSHWINSDFKDIGFTVECKGSEGLFRIIITRLHLANLTAKISRMLSHGFICYLIAYRRKKSTSLP